MPPPRDSPVRNGLGLDSDYMTDPVHSDTYSAISPLHADLTGKAVFITGASRGLGRALATSYARAGASHIAIGARSDLNATAEATFAAAAQAHRPVPDVLKVVLDVKSQESVATAAKDVRQRFGRIDIVVNNAGMIVMPSKVADSDPDAWWNPWEVNLRGAYYVTRSFLPLLLESEAGLKTILNVSSVGAHLTNPGLSSYQTSKLAMLRFAEFVQNEYADQGIANITVHPGNMLTDIVNDFGGLPPELEPIFVDTPELAADTIVFLTKEKRQWLGGRYVNCTWDMPQLMSMEDEIVKGDKLKVRLVW